MTTSVAKGRRPLRGDAVTAALLRVSRRLAREVDALRFGPPVTHVYNPLVYAAAPHALYLRRFGAGKGRVLLLGMNPGPFGMVQTGVPFGDVTLVRDWLGISGPVKKPAMEHPRRPVLGFDNPRAEVSGSRLWGWARARFGTPARFFRSFFILNYCPLAFMEGSARNRTPDKLPGPERDTLYRACDRALRDATRALDPSCVVGIGAFAERRAREALAGLPPSIGGILHPSPANPRANRGWSTIIERELAALGVQLPRRG
jgi:single-strand selective monofunctional uracil DNA glycosylase